MEKVSKSSKKEKKSKNYLILVNNDPHTFIDASFDLNKMEAQLTTDDLHLLTVLTININLIYKYEDGIVDVIASIRNVSPLAKGQKLITLQISKVNSF